MGTQRCSRAQQRVVGMGAHALARTHDSSAWLSGFSGRPSLVTDHARRSPLGPLKLADCDGDTPPASLP